MKPSDLALVKAIAASSGGGGGGSAIVPNIQMTAHSLPAGSEPTVERSGSNTNPVFAFGIPEGQPGTPGKNGATFTPAVSENGLISWTNDGGLENPAPVNIKGPPGPAGSGIDITFSDGLTKDGDTVSVTTPVRGVYIQEEFDALPEAERNKGLYVVNDGKSGGGSGGVTMDQVNEAISATVGDINTILDSINGEVA